MPPPPPPRGGRGGGLAGTMPMSRLGPKKNPPFREDLS